MEGAWLARVRWRHRGAWLWPVFAILSAADAVIGHALPPSGESQTLLGAALAAVFVALLSAGLLHRPSVLAHRNAMQDAISRAQAWIGDRAPAEFRRNIEYVSTVAIEPGSIYRTCVPSINDRRRMYCVIVKTHLPFAESVSFDGHEPNDVFSQGTG